MLNVFTLLVELEPAQAELLEKICGSALISHDDLQAAGALELPPDIKKKIVKQKASGPSLFEAQAEN